ncbi:MAG: transposase [Desulfobacteraceae bacterium]
MSGLHSLEEPADYGGLSLPLYPDGLVLKRTWAGEETNVSVLVAIGVNEHGYRKVLGIVEGAREDKAGALQKRAKNSLHYQLVSLE